jgi:uncharacterized DUF497 family protein
MFRWDESKREKVIAENGVDFAGIEDIFDDPFGVYYDDFNHSGEEMRYAVIGKTARYGLVILIFSAQGEEIRFITARRAEKWMVKKYERQRKRY